MTGATGTDLAALLAEGEKAAFHGKPATAATALEAAVALARDQQRAAECTAAAWLLGVALGAGGRYGAALRTLDPLAAEGGAAGARPEQRLFGSLAGSTAASVHRQLGRHAAARDADRAALALADDAAEAAYDAHLGLAADAVGLGEQQEAERELAEAEALVADRSGEWWRQRVRLGWVTAEVALLGGAVDLAAEAAAAAVDRAEAARAPRHVAKGLLFLGVAQLQGGDDAAPTTLRRAATLAEGLGTVPLVWPARALLGALLADDDAEESARSLAAARGAVAQIAEDLPDDLRAEWLARGDVAALLDG